MKGFLLAAGVGTRLRPLTYAIPKCLVPIRGTPLLAIWLEWCAMYGIDEILLNSHAHSDRVREFVDASRGPVRVTLTHEPELLGSAGTVHVNRKFVAGEKEFAVLYADVLTNCRLAGSWIFTEHATLQSHWEHTAFPIRRNAESSPRTNRGG